MGLYVLRPLLPPRNRLSSLHSRRLFLLLAAERRIRRRPPGLPTPPPPPHLLRHDRLNIFGQRVRQVERDGPLGIRCREYYRELDGHHGDIGDYSGHVWAGN